MKKYVKPMVAVERYELSQNISNCAWELNTATKETCQATADEDFLGSGWSGPLFMTQNGCTYKSDGGYEDYCYQTGSGSPFPVFSS